MNTDIVIIDDNEQYLQNTTQLFNYQGYSTRSISEPETAMDLIIRSNPRLIILDIMMPGINGFTLLKNIKAHPDVSSIPVIILSGKVFPPEKKKAITLGAEKYLTKPIYSRALLEEIGTYL